MLTDLLAALAAATMYADPDEGWTKADRVIYDFDLGDPWEWHREYDEAHDQGLIEMRPTGVEWTVHDEVRLTPKGLYELLRR